MENLNMTFLCILKFNFESNIVDPHNEAAPRKVNIVFATQ